MRLESKFVPQGFLMEKSNFVFHSMLLSPSKAIKKFFTKISLKKCGRMVKAETFKAEV